MIEKRGSAEYASKTTIPSTDHDDDDMEDEDDIQITPANKN